MKGIEEGDHSSNLWSRLAPSVQHPSLSFFLLFSLVFVDSAYHPEAISRIIFAQISAPLFETDHLQKCLVYSTNN